MCETRYPLKMDLGNLAALSSSWEKYLFIDKIQTVVLGHRPQSMVLTFSPGVPVSIYVTIMETVAEV